MQKNELMQYQVTCNKCHRPFTINSEGSDRIHCTCPYCGQSLLVNLPTVAQPVTPSVQPTLYDVQKNEGASASTKILLSILIVLLLGGLSVFVFIQWQQHQESERELLAAQRKAHADSVLQVRAKQQMQDAAAQRKTDEQKSVCRFLDSFYRKAVFTSGDPSYYVRYLTPYCRQMIFGVDPFGEDEDVWNEWWAAFGDPSSGDDFDEMRRNLQVTPLDDNWYKVRLSEHGVTVFRKIKVKVSDGHVLIDDIR